MKKFKNLETDIFFFSNKSNEDIHHKETKII